MPTRLNLGCGADYMTDWVNIDVREQYSPNIVGDITKLHYPEESVDEVLASHSLSYLPYREAMNMLRKCYTWLKVGSRMEIRMPDFEEIVAKVPFYKEEARNGYTGWEAINIGIFGFENDGPHSMQSVWCREDLTEQLERIGFTHIKMKPPRDDYELILEAFK